MKIGTLDVDDFKIGDDQVDKIMIGTIEVWSSGGGGGIIKNGNFTNNIDDWTLISAGASSISWSASYEGSLYMNSGSSNTLVMFEQVVACEIGKEYTFEYVIQELPSSTSPRFTVGISTGDSSLLNNAITNEGVPVQAVFTATHNPIYVGMQIPANSFSTKAMYVEHILDVT